VPLSRRSALVLTTGAAAAAGAVLLKNLTTDMHTPGRGSPSSTPPIGSRSEGASKGASEEKPFPGVNGALPSAALGDHVRFGAYTAGMVADPRRLADYEARTQPVQVASYFYGFGDEFPADIERRFSDGGRRDVLIAWDMGATRFADWASGRHDAYLRVIGAHARAYPYPLYVRPWPEMNGDWQSFQPTSSGSKRDGGTPAEFVDAWRHVVDRIRSAGGTNVKWVFNPTADTNPWTTDIRTIWPGADVVDVLGLDGFNWGSGGRFVWQEFEQIFRDQYARITSLHLTAPVWICEYGCKEPAVDDGAPIDPQHAKGAWISRMLSTTAFPRVTTLIAFDARKERDWRIASSPESLQTWRRCVAALAAGGRSRR
jgi:hypothetical protein